MLYPTLIAILVPIVGVSIVCLQIWGSYKRMKEYFPGPRVDPSAGFDPVSPRRHQDRRRRSSRALAPLAGKAAGFLFALGIVGVGFLAVPVKTGGAAYDLRQTAGWKYGLDKRPKQEEVLRRYCGLTAVAIAISFAGINLMKALVIAGIAQGFSTPALIFADHAYDGQSKNYGRSRQQPGINILGWRAIATIFAASLALLWTWLV